MGGNMRALFVSAAGLGLAAIAAGPAWADLTSVMVDVSAYNDVGKVIDGAKAAGVELIMHRATLGASRTDKTFVADYRAIKDAKLGAGAYHFLYPPITPGDPTSNGTAQARAFLSAISSTCKKNETVLLALDWETYVKPKLPADPPPPPLPEESAPQAPAPAATAAEFVKEVQRLTGVTPLIYTDASTLKQRQAADLDPAIKAAPLWFARIHRNLRFDNPSSVTAVNGPDDVTITLKRDRVDTLAMPLPEEMAPWTQPTFWQFSAGTTFDAHSNPLGWPAIHTIEPQLMDIDADWFVGSRDAFHAFVKTHSWKCDPKAPTTWSLGVG